MPLGMEEGLCPGHIVLDGDPAPPTERGTVAPTFQTMSIVAKWLPISANAQLLFDLNVYFTFYSVIFQLFSFNYQ